MISWHCASLLAPANFLSLKYKLETLDKIEGIVFELPQISLHTFNYGIILLSKTYLTII